MSTEIVFYHPPILLMIILIYVCIHTSFFNLLENREKGKGGGSWKVERKELEKKLMHE